MKIKQDDLLALFEALGFKNPQSWDEKTLRTKVGRLPMFRANAEELTDEGLKEFYGTVAGAVEAREDILIDPAGGVDTPDKTQASTTRKAPAAGRKTTDAKETKKSRYHPKSRNPEGGKWALQSPRREVKVIRPALSITKTVVQMLANATANKPVSRNDIHAELVKLFPGRDPHGMMITVRDLTSTRLRNVYDVTVSRSGDRMNPRFWIDPEVANNKVGMQKFEAPPAGRKTADGLPGGMRGRPAKSSKAPAAGRGKADQEKPPPKNGKSRKVPAAGRGKADPGKVSSVGEKKVKAKSR